MDEMPRIIVPEVVIQILATKIMEYQKKKERGQNSEKMACRELSEK